MMWRFWLILGILSGCAAEGALDDTTNRAPVANAGADFVVTQGDVVSLSGHRSVDLDGDALTYRWALVAPTGSSATLINTNGVETQFTADAAGKYTLSLVVSDGKVDSPVDTLVVTATPKSVVVENRAPVARAGNDANVQRGTTVQLDGTGSSDADGDPLTFTWSIEERPAGSNAVLSSDSAPRPAFIADVDGTYLVRLVVSDGQVSSAVDSLTVTAFSSNTPPVANAGPDQTVGLGNRVQLDGTTSFDADGDEILFTWTMVSKPSGSSAVLSDGASATPNFLTDLEGAYVLELVVSDGQTPSAPDTLTITAMKNNLPPVAHAGINATVPVGDLVELDGTQSFDANDDALTYSWSWVTRPAGSTADFSSTTVVKPTFTPDVEGDFIAQLIVNDGTVDSAPDSVTVTASVTNVPPVADAGVDQAVRTGSPVLLDGTGSSDGDGDGLSFVWTFTGRPMGSVAVLADATTSMPSFTPDVDGTYVVQLVVNDGRVDSAADSMVVTAATPALPSPGAEGDVVITEFMADPAGFDDSVGEWFEIFNPTSTRWDLQNCVISDLGSDSQIIGGSLVIGPGEYRTFAKTANPGFVPYYVYGSGYFLANKEDEIILTCNGVEIAQVVYAGAFTIEAGVSEQLDVSKYDEILNDSAANWCGGTMVYSTVNATTDKGTPGTANASCP